MSRHQRKMLHPKNNLESTGKILDYNVILHIHLSLHPC